MARSKNNSAPHTHIMQFCYSARFLVTNTPLPRPSVRPSVCPLSGSKVLLSLTIISMTFTVPIFAEYSNYGFIWSDVMQFPSKRRYLSTKRHGFTSWRNAMLIMPVISGPTARQFFTTSSVYAHHLG
jgi:hypothetical protein